MASIPRVFVSPSQRCLEDSSVMALLLAVKRAIKYLVVIISLREKGESTWSC